MIAAGAGLERWVVGLSRALRRAGVPAGIDRSEAFARALTMVDVTSRREVHLAARATLVGRREDLPVFEAVFAAFSSGDAGAGGPRRAPRAPRHDDRALHRTAFVSYMAEKARRDDPEVDLPEDAKAASALELLQTKDFGRLTPEEREAVRRAMQGLRFELARRVTRRHVAARRGRSIDLRRALRASARTGGLVPVLPRRRRKIKPRALVVLADVSGSMELYARLLLQFMHGVARVHRLAETFVFGTRLTPITRELRVRDVERALDGAAAAIADFAGGTRIGESLRAFNRLHAGRVLRRGAVLLIISDGWETGDREVLREEMAKLARRSHRVIWLNPLLGRATYRPLAEGMALALEHVDDFLPIHNLKALRQLSEHLARLPARKGARRGRRSPGRGDAP